MAQSISVADGLLSNLCWRTSKSLKLF